MMFVFFAGIIASLLLPGHFGTIPVPGVLPFVGGRLERQEGYFHLLNSPGEGERCLIVIANRREAVLPDTHAGTAAAQDRRHFHFSAFDSIDQESDDSLLFHPGETDPEGADAQRHLPG